MNLPLYRKIEIAFWDLAIDSLTQSQFIRQIVKDSNELYHCGQWKIMLGLITASGAFGFLLGFAIPHFWTIVR